MINNGKDEFSAERLWDADRRKRQENLDESELPPVGALVRCGSSGSTAIEARKNP
jgi:hypothetical protein